MTLPVILLAAGCSRRFGDADKRLARISPSETLLEASLTPFSDRSIHLALRLSDRGAPWLDALCARFPTVQPVFCTRSEQGMGATLSEALSRSEAKLDKDAVLVALGDMPSLTPEVVERVEASAGALNIVRPWLLRSNGAGLPGHPVAWGRAFWPALKGLTGDNAGKCVIAAHPEVLVRLEMSDPRACHDVDRPDALRRY
ncbi:nucleotidyltransferase family protein [Larsenimonas suaedae]|uniref:NTP transferase domain-containing protein n=1 Tax=Larsenimonas suaedae TaxID=1851019 RepID=A0ABU1GUK0_9GAMM|nr:NTP transferase domain-containing protein [Larsenimonas suaedae]MCM2971710.1 NTP transferase domain-containing protein [Larsenimonas suaedae]MDR5895262.1 NTP transferase domain-containing protein [Larsenimonas suaedae]